jgi:hypothetical protein
MYFFSPIVSFTVFIRFKQIKLELLNTDLLPIDSKEIKRIELYNKLCHYFGHFISFGVLIIGNYRMTEIIAGHAIGVIIAFSSAILYQALMVEILKLFIREKIFFSIK